MTAGLPHVSPKFPFIVGSDGAGVVEAVGKAVQSVRPGDRVMINPGISCGRCPACLDGDEPLCRELPHPGRARPGTAAEFVVVPEENLAPVPDGMGWAEAAGFTLSTLTAWRMLAGRARLRGGRDGTHLGDRRRRFARGSSDRQPPRRPRDRDQRQ